MTDLQNLAIPFNHPLVVYTAITNDYDILRPLPSGTAHIADSVAFVDRPHQCGRSSGWAMAAAHDGFSDPNRNAKIHKILPHRYFPNHSYSLWIDGNVDIVYSLPLSQLVENFLMDADLAVFGHPVRSCLYEEATMCIQRRLDDESIIRNQMARYRREGYPRGHGLVEASVILRRHCTAVKHFNELWWHEVHTGSRRDQLSFNYAARKANLRIAYFPGTIRKPNDIFIKRHHRRKSDRFWKNAPLA